MHSLFIAMLIAAFPVSVFASSPTASQYNLQPISTQYGEGVSFVQPKGVALKSIADAINAESQAYFHRDAIFAGELLQDPGMNTVPVKDVVHRLVPLVNQSNYLTRTQQTEYFNKLGISFADRAIVTVAAGLQRLAKGFAAAGTRPDLDAGDLLGGYWTRAASKSLHVDPVEGVNAFNPQKDVENGYGYDCVYSPALLPDAGGPAPAPGTVEVFDTPYGTAARFVQPAGKTLSDVVSDINKQSLIKYQRRAVDIETLPNDQAMKEIATTDKVYVVVPRVQDSNFKPLNEQEDFLTAEGLKMANRSVVTTAAALFRLQNGFAPGQIRPDADKGDLLGGMWTRSPEGWVSFQPDGLDTYLPARDAVGGYGHEGIFAAAIVR